MKYYKCPECQTIKTSEEINKDLLNGGPNGCDCQWTDGDRIVIPYVEISEEEFTRLLAFGKDDTVFPKVRDLIQEAAEVAFKGGMNEKLFQSIATLEYAYLENEEILLKGKH